MLKFFFWTLLLINAALFAYQEGYLDPLFSDGREPKRAARQLNVDKLKLLPLNANVPAVVAEPAADIFSDSLVAAVDEKKPEEKKTEPLACTEIGDFNEADAKRFETQLAALTLGSRVTQRKIEEVASHMVFIPGQGSKEGADRKVNELRKIRVQDFYIIQDNSPLRWGISLGVFKTQEAAKNRLAELNKQGVRSARIGSRSVTAAKVVFQLRELDGSAKERVDKIKSEFPQQSVRSCAAAPTATTVPAIAPAVTATSTVTP